MSWEPQQGSTRNGQPTPKAQARPADGSTHTKIQLAALDIVARGGEEVVLFEGRREDCVKSILALERRWGWSLGH